MIDLITFHIVSEVTILGIQRLVKTSKTAGFTSLPLAPRQATAENYHFTFSQEAVHLESLHCGSQHQGWVLNMATNHPHSACFSGGRSLAKVTSSPVGTERISCPSLLLFTNFLSTT